MKRLCTILLCVLLIASMTISAYAVSSVPKPVIESTESVVRIIAEYSDGYTTGSGFVIKSDTEETLIATNYHVVEETPYSISVWLDQEETVNATILAYTDQKDMCILKLAYPVSLRPLIFADNEVKQGDAAYAVGFPGAADYLSDKEAHTSVDATITDGIISAVREATVSSYGTPVKMLQINAAINAGNSGGPLFNTHGEVIGINTYSITDSQGIFGAIDISEFKSFMVDQAIPIATKKVTSHGWFLAAAAVIVACLMAVTIVVIRKKRMKKHLNAGASFIPLCEYMAAHPDGVGVHDAVAMLLPVALQLRDLHNNGSAHLQVSPNSISVGPNGASLAGATSAEANRYTSGYAAPEIYKGMPAGNLSDIYSFCAVLSYVSSGKQPMNALSRTDADPDEAEITQLDTVFEEVIRTGMALDAAERFASMQDVIVKLSAYNKRPFVNIETTEQTTGEEILVKKRKVSAKAVAIASILILLLASLGTYIGCYFGAKTAAGNGDFAHANNLLFVAPITNLHDPALVSYIEAGQLMDARKNEDATAAFKALSGYLNADEMAMEADYRYALQCADANRFTDAISIMDSLSEAGYKDSKEKTLDLQYRKGVYLLQEKSAFEEARRIFSKLVNEGYTAAVEMRKEAEYLWAFDLYNEGSYVAAYEKYESIRDYADAEECLDALAGIMYYEGQSLYYEQSFEDAQNLFKCISPYEDSDDYLTLIEAHSKVFSRLSARIAEPIVEQLTAIFYFEDAAELLVSQQVFAKQFLRGTWRTSNGSYYFTISDDFSSSYNLPFTYNNYDYYKIENGTYIKYNKDGGSEQPQFQFTLITPDCMEVYCYKNGLTYTLYR